MGDNNTYLTGVVWKIGQDSACKVSNGIWYKVGTSLSQHRDKERKEGGDGVGSVTHSLGDRGLGFLICKMDSNKFCTLPGYCEEQMRWSI